MSKGSTLAMGFLEASAGVREEDWLGRARAGMKEGAKGDGVGSAGLLEDCRAGSVDAAGVGAGAGAAAELEADEDDELNRLAQDLAGWAAGVATGGGGAYDGAGMTWGRAANGTCGGGTDISGGGPGGGWMCSDGSRCGIASTFLDSMVGGIETDSLKDFWGASGCLCCADEDVGGVAVVPSAVNGIGEVFFW